MNDDRPAFDRILKWTVDNLQVRRDALLAWSWDGGPTATGTSSITTTPATETSSSPSRLLKAAQRWDHPPHRQAAQRIIRDIRTQLAVTVKDYRLIAPAYFGFNGDAGHVFNTGYLVLPAFAEFARVDNTSCGKGCSVTAGGCWKEALFSRFKLPARLGALENGQVTVRIGPRSPFFDTRPSGCRSTWPGTAPGSAWRHWGLSAVLENAGYLPSRVNLIDGTVSADEAPAGFYAVMGLWRRAVGPGAAGPQPAREAAARIAREPKDYSQTPFICSPAERWSDDEPAASFS